MLTLNIWTKGYTRMFCVLIGIAVSYAVSAALGLVNLSAGNPTHALPLVALPSFRLSMSFDITLLAPFVVAALAGTLHLMGNISKAQRVNDDGWTRPDFRSLSAGLTGNGIANVICGLTGSLGFSAYSSCIGVSTATGITSWSVAYVIGIIYALLALVPGAAIVVATIPAPVIGGALFFTAAFVLASGLQMITARMIDTRKILVIGFSFAMAMMPDIYQGVFAAAPIVLHPVLGNGLALGTTCAVLLNLIMRIGIRQRARVRLPSGAAAREAVETFLAEQGGHWAARRDVVNRAVFGVVQVLELLGDPPGGIELEASFDEFNLDLRLRYAGAVSRQQRQSPRNHGEPRRRAALGRPAPAPQRRPHQLARLRGTGRGLPTVRPLTTSLWLPAQGQQGHVVRFGCRGDERVEALPHRADDRLRRGCGKRSQCCAKAFVGESFSTAVHRLSDAVGMDR
jgi:NCS2 family nucleobase:cation symporter-2